MKENSDNQLIEDYIDGNLKGAELVNFQERLRTDNEFAKAYNLRLKLASLWREADEYQQTREHVRKIMDAEKKPRFINQKKTYYLLAIAASIVLLLGTYWLMNKQNSGFFRNPINQMAESSDTLLFQMDKPEKLTKITYAIQLVSPENKQSFILGDTIVFQWKSPVDTVKTELLIKSISDNKVVFQFADHPTNTVRLASEILGPGEYTWFVRDTTNLRFFTIKKR
jgi:hypothetical protein